VVSSHSGTPLGVGISHRHFGPRDTSRPRPREYATTILPIVYSATLGDTHARVSLFLGTPGTPGLESWNCPETVPGGVPGLWELITPDCGVWSRRGLNQTYSPRRDLSNDVSPFRYIALSIRRSGRGRFPIFSGRESNCQFDSRPFFCP
jgi:hypothetical protein